MVSCKATAYRCKACEPLISELPPNRSTSAGEGSLNIRGPPFPSALCTVQEWLKPERAARLVLEDIIDICCIWLEHLIRPASNDVLHSSSKEMSQI